MSDPLATYSFLPWVRQGIANKITSSGGVRATVKVELTISGEGSELPVSANVTKDVQLIGPGDIVGIEARSIVRTEPRDWITNFEPNYLPFVEFYDEDFPWRYTPAAPDGKGRLQPWLTLVVLEEGEFKEVSNAKDRPLPSINVADASQLFPKTDSLWAWAHVHINRNVLPGPGLASDDMSQVLPKFESVLNENPDLAYSRLLCPRKLKDNTPYHAFLLPTFESGRMAGLGQDPGSVTSATQPAWANPGALDFPV